MVPPGINLIKRMHHFEYKQIRDAWKRTIFALAGRNKEQLEAWADSCNLLTVKIHIEHPRQFDPDNLVSAAKIPLDCLTLLHFIQNDTPEFIKLGVTQEKSREKQTTIEVSQ